MENPLKEKNPCIGCLIITVCCDMCDKAKPYFQSLTTVDKNFDWGSYERRREELFQKWYNEARQKDTPESREEFRRRYNMDDNEIFDIIISRDKEKEIIEEYREKLKKEKKHGRRTGTNAGTKILRKIKHFCSLNFKDKTDNKG